MLDHAYKIGTRLAVKEASTRLLRELLEAAEKVSPGTRSAWRSQASKKDPSRNSSVLDVLRQRRGLGKDQLPSPELSEYEKLREAYMKTLAPGQGVRPSHSIGGIRRFFAGTPMQKADHLRDLSRQLSGRHPLREGETLLPAQYTAELTASQTPKSPFLFRGNPVTAGDPSQLAHLTRHPDVGAGYAVGNTRMQQGTPTERLFVYRKNQVRGGVEGSADTVQRAVAERMEGRKGREAARRMLEEERLGGAQLLKRTSPELRDAGLYNPTYETVLPSKNVPSPLGEYSVRQTRTPAGLPAYAVSDVRGPKFQDIMRTVRP